MNDTRRRGQIWMRVLVAAVLIVVALGLKVMLPSTKVNKSASPTITGFKPMLGGVGAVVRIRGAHLGDAIDVSFNGTRAHDVTVISETALDVVVPEGATSGSISVRHGSTFRSAGSFTVEPTPTITAMSATSGGVRMHLTLTGTNLTGTRTISFNGQRARTFAVTSDTEIDVSVPVGATSGNIVLTTLGGTATSPTAFNIVPAPTVTRFAPLEAGVSAKVTITGTGFVGVSAVLFDTTSATDFSATSPTEIVVVVPSGATSGRVSVVTAGGTGTRSRFTVVSQPAITGLSVKAAAIGTVLTITGTDLIHTKAVTFNGVTATLFTTPNSRMVRVTIPTGATTGFVAITTPGGTASSPTEFTVLPG